MDKSKIRLRRLGQALVLVLVVAGLTAAFSNVRPITEQYGIKGNLLGNYLAGRYARGQRDSSTAADYYGKALSEDPKNAVILEQAFLLEVAAADWPRAIALAEDLVDREPNNRLARFMLGMRAFKDGEFADAKTHLAAADKEPISNLTRLLARAWIELAQGQPDSAFKTLDSSSMADWTLHHRRYHKALIADIADQPEVAGRAYAMAFEKNPRAGRLAIAYASHAAHKGDLNLAREVLSKHLERVPRSARAATLLKQLDGGETPELIITSPADGIAEVFYGIGDALAGEEGFEIATIYLQMALYLTTDFTLAQVSLGEIYQSGGKHELAIKAYDAVPEGSQPWLESQIKKAFSLNSLERVDDAKTILDALANKAGDDTRPLDALGDILRVHKRCGEALPYYDRAVKLVEVAKKQHAALFFSRGICHERSDQWKKAEIDFKKSLELDPAQPPVLNYLGYTWIDKGLNLKDAMALIRKAVKLDPNAGYIVDSLGWAHYRLGNFPEAVEHLERATELSPDDSVINDHLGDAYWRVGRRFEARYQWTQALSLEPEPEEERKIKKKLANGLEVPRQIKAQASVPDADAKKDN